MQPQDFLQLAIPAAQAAENATGIPASITIAQAALESGWGDHIPPGSYNFFGLKAVPGQPSVMSMTDEFINGVKKRMEQPFRKFDSFSECFADRCKWLSTSSHFAAAMNHTHSSLDYVTALQSGPYKYSTSPFYVKSVMQLVNQYDLTKYDSQPNLA